MEKYGADFSDLPVTEDQINKIASLNRGNFIATPKNREEADKIIEELLEKRGGDKCST